MIAFTVTYPPLTGNHQHWHIKATGGKRLRPEMKAWRTEVWASAFQAGVVLDLKGPLKAEYLCYPPPRARPDGGNLEKVISDALQSAQVVRNDNRIKRCTWEVFPNSQNPRIEIRLEPL